MADGYIVYQGIANQTPSYLQGLGFKFGRFANPADIFMRVLTINYPKKDEDISKIDNLVSSYKSKLEPEVEREIASNKIPDYHLQSGKRKTASFCLQFS